MSLKQRTSPIRVLVVDDALLMRQVISDVINEADGLTVMGTATNGLEALEIIRRDRPDVVSLDIQMPGMDGFETLDEILKEHPIPVIVVSSLSQRSADATLDAIERGAMDYVAKPQGMDGIEDVLRGELVRKIRTIATTDVRRVLEIRDARRQRREQAATVAITAADREAKMDGLCLAIGISTGGPPALTFLMEKLRPPLPPIVIVQHMPAEFTAAFAKRLDSASPLSVKEAATRDVLGPNCAFVAPGGKHTSIQRVSGGLQLVVRDGPLVSGHRPSVDVMMESAAKHFGEGCLGIIMTGMGRDGVDGCAAIRAAGGFVLGQDESTSDVYGMNKAAFMAGHVDRQFGLPRLPQEISARMLRFRNRKAAKSPMA